MHHRPSQISQKFDAIVIGSGIAGLNFALRAAEKWKRILVVTKKKAAESGTNFAQGGIAAVLSKVDNFDRHVRDTLVAGCFHNNRRAVSYMVRHGPEAIQRLLEFGVPFTTKDGKMLLTREGGHSKRRIAFVSDYTGQAIEKTLVARLRRNPRISLWEDTFAADLLVSNGSCYGVRVLHREGRRSFRFHNVSANATALATGGIGQLFSNTTNPSISTGDGLAMAGRAGLAFRDLEFIQFHPTALNMPHRPRFLISEAVRGEGAYIKNSRGERFMVGRHPLAELAPRDIVSRAIFQELKNGPVFLDLRHIKKEVTETRFPVIFRTLRSYGVDMSRDLIPIAPAAHYLCGGARINLKGETGVKNLFAFGETAWTGVHGANRLASNSLLEALVFSRRILEADISSPSVSHRFPLPRWQAASFSEQKKIASFKKELRKIMWDDVGIVRTADGLKRAMSGIERIKKESRDLAAVNVESLELHNMLTAAELIVEAASRRKKSLGCHFMA
ncbi:L-aspartate oxidase [Candidatus Peregrinibacteria bacterium]|nr:L-aspartate oxidase [Candidatus Peregrinibacteria bacterium]